MHAYRQEIEQVAQALHTDMHHGLTKKEAHKRLRTHGANVLPAAKEGTWLSSFLSQFASPLIYILLVAALLNFFFGDDRRDSFLISGVVIFNALIGMIQEGRARTILASLHRLVKTKTIVIRDGEHIIADDAQLVVGDLIVLRSGERVPADARVIESNNLQVDESSLTGESLTVRKVTHALDTDLPVADRINMVFQGTYIIAGTGKAIVTATAQQTELGHIHRVLKDIDTQLPLKKEINQFSYLILIFTLTTCLALFGIGLLEGRPLQELISSLIALFVCVVPEGLPVVLTLVLVTGAYHMARRFVLVKKLQAIDTIGRADVIIIDKTGTLTRNEMMVSTVLVDGQWWHVSGEGYFAQGSVRLDDHDGASLAQDSALKKMGVAAALLNTADIVFIPHLNIFEITGDQTEAALSIFAKKLGLESEQLKKTYTPLYEIPFDPQLRYHAGFFSHHGRIIAFMIGAPESLLKHCTQYQREHAAFHPMLEQGLRVVGFGYKEIAADAWARMQESDERGLLHHAVELLATDCQLLGFCGIQDTVRTGLQEVISQVREAGIRVVVASGDHEQTVMHVAQQVGIFKPGDERVSGTQLYDIDDELICDRLHHITVFFRVSPADKVRIVKLFRDCGYVVAMTGDGMNDAPALAAADLGIAMGGIGAAVAKQAADMVLLDDSFVNINNGIALGRHILHSLRRVILYFSATNMGEIIVVLIAMVANYPLPILAPQILWLNLVTDGFLDVSLAMEPQPQGLIRSAWLESKTRLIDSTLIAKMFFMGIPMGVGSFLVFRALYTTDLAYARTMTLQVMAMYQWFNAWNCRSEHTSLFKLGFFANRWLILATSLVLGLQMIILYVPFMRELFKTVPLSFCDWAFVVVVTAPIILLEEARKWLAHRYGQSFALTNLLKKLRYTKEE